MRTKDLIERQLAIAIKNNQPRLIKRLEAELSTMVKPEPIGLIPNKPMKDTLDNRAAFAFYNS